MKANAYAPAEVMKKLAENENLIPANDRAFYFSVKQQFSQRGISEKQLYWMRRFLEEFVLSAEQASYPREKLDCEQVPKMSFWEKWNFRELQDKIQQARTDHGLKFPKIKLTCDSKECSHRSYEIYWSEYYKTVSIKVGSNFIGHISHEGNIIPAPRYKELTADGEELMKKHLSFLQTFNDDPAEGAKVQGKLTGNCCFCGHELSTDESLSAGYGPICAAHFSLPWGRKTGSGKGKEILLSDLDEEDEDDSIPF